MLKAFWIFAAISVFFSSSAFSSEIDIFFRSSISQLWHVSGAALKEQAMAPTCTAEAELADGSYLHLSKDIDNNLFFLWVNNPDWIYNEKELLIRLDFYNGNRSVSSASLRAIVQNNSLDIPLENPKAFLERLILSNRLTFSIPKRSRKFSVAVDKPFLIVDEIGKCIEAWAIAKKTTGAQAVVKQLDEGTSRSGTDVGSKLPYGSKGGTDLTVQSVAGLDTENAAIKGIMTRQDALAFCGSNAPSGQSAKCLADMVQHARTLRPAIQANCVTKEFTDFSGERFVFLGANPDRDKNDGENHARYVLKNLATGDISDGTNATGYYTRSALFSALCPKSAPIDW